jgi:hypothetical protein
MRGFLIVVRRALRKMQRREGGGREAAGLGEDASSGLMRGPVRSNRKLECIRLRFRRVMGKYEMTAAKARGRYFS